jgi:hypothetical protein
MRAATVLTDTALKYLKPRQKLYKVVDRDGTSRWRRHRVRGNTGGRQRPC